MDPLPQYGAHTFVPYLPTVFPTSSTSPPTTSSDLKSKSTTLSPLTLHNTSSWTYCGPVLSPTSSSLPPSFHTWSSTTISGPFLPRLLPLLAYLQSFLRKAGAQHYWLTIRATKPTNEYDTARWHTDDVFFDYDGEKDRVGFEQSRRISRTKTRLRGVGRKRKNGYWKLATTLLGPGTLFLANGAQARRTQRAAKRAECEKRGAHTCTQFRCLSCLDAVESVRQTLAAAFSNQAVESPGYGEIAFFRLGDEEGAVHSEPPCDTDRIFVNIVPGTEQELRALMGRWGLSFPRAWCFGCPVEFDGMRVLEQIEREEKANSVVDIAEMDLSEKNTEERFEGLLPTDTLDAERSLSTMSMNLKDEYMDWLKGKGFKFAHVFGHTNR